LNAYSLLSPHISIEGEKLRQTFGLSGFPNKRHSLRSFNWMHLVPAGLPFGIPGISDDIEIMMQHAAHPERQFIFLTTAFHILKYSIFYLNTISLNFGYFGSNDSIL